RPGWFGRRWGLGLGDGRFLHPHVGRECKYRQANQSSRAPAQQNHGNRSSARITVRVAVQGRPEKQKEKEKRRQHKSADDLIRPFKMLEELKKEHEVPFGTSLVGLRGIGLRFQGRRPKLGPQT